MKLLYYQFFIAALFYSITCAALSLENYKKIPIPKVQSIYESFENQPADWKLSSEFQLATGEGRNGTNALVCERLLPKHYSFASHKIKLVPGIIYQASVWVRGENIESSTNDRNAGAICLEYHKGGKWHSGTYPRYHFTDNNWHQVTFKFTAKKQDFIPKIVLYMRKGFTGKIWFDDLKIEPAAAKRACIYLTKPSNLTLANGAGIIRLKVHLLGKQKFVKNRYALHLEAIAEGKSQIKISSLNSMGIAQDSFGPFPSAPVTLKATLLNQDSKSIVDSNTFVLNSVTPYKPPKGNCIIDQYNRTIVDGNVFMPIGIFAGNLNNNDLKRIAQAGFNTVMPYSSFELKTVHNEDTNPFQRLKKSLDTFSKHNLKIVFSLKDQYPGKKWSTETLGSTQGLNNVTGRVVRTLRKHPSLLAWYLSDEEIRSNIPDIIKLRQLVNSLDPYHPTYSLTFRLEDFPYYAETGDIMGIDPYPIKTKNSQDIIDVDKAMNTVKHLGLPTWFVIQAFNWGVYRTKNKGLDYFKNTFRFPTENDMRSIALMAALKGAKGFLFYSYGDIFTRGEKFVPESSKVEWAKVRKIVKLLKELQPFLMSTVAKPEIHMTKNHDNRISASAFKNSEGKIRVLIASTGPNQCSAEIHIPGYNLLKSKYGHTKSIGNGKYSFSGNNICSDILYQD